MATSTVRIGIVQMAMSSSFEKNVKKALDGVREAASRGAGLVCLPELFAWKYFPTVRDSKEAPIEVPGPLTRALSQSAKENSIILVGGTVYEKSGAARYNTCLVFDEKGRTVSKYRKVHVPQDEHYYEQDYFSSGSGYSVARTSAGGVGTLICFDQWYPEAARINRLMGANLIFYPTAIGWVKGIEPVEGDWKQAWESVQVGHAIANSVVLCAVNRVGREGNTSFWGGSFICDQFGKVIFRAGEEEGIFVSGCDLRLEKTIEDGWGFMRNRHTKTYSAISR